MHRKKQRKLSCVEYTDVSVPRDAVKSSAALGRKQTTTTAHCQKKTWYCSLVWTLVWHTLFSTSVWLLQQHLTTRAQWERWPNKLPIGPFYCRVSRRKPINVIGAGQTYIEQEHLMVACKWAVEAVLWWLCPSFHSIMWCWFLLFGLLIESGLSNLALPILACNLGLSSAVTLVTSNIKFWTWGLPL